MDKKHTILIAYFSWSGNTRRIAQQIYKNIGGDIIEIKCVSSYSSDYNTCISEAKRDKQKQARPEIIINIPDISQYNTIFLGYPNWWSSIPMPIAAFLEQFDFSEKTIIPFCSHGGGGLGHSEREIAQLCPQATLLKGLDVYGSQVQHARQDVKAWLKSIGIFTDAGWNPERRCYSC